MKISALDSLSLSQHWSGITPATLKVRQGDLDGACGPYALFNALVVGQFISQKKVTALFEAKRDRRTSLDAWMREHGGFVIDGTKSHHLENLLLALQKKIKTLSKAKFEKIANISRSKSSSVQWLENIAKSIEKGPVLVGVEWNKSSGHWAVAVGVQSRTNASTGKEEIAHLLLIDSGEALHATQFWNAIIGLGSRDAKLLRYSCVSENKSTPCSIVEAYLIPMKKA